MEAIDEGHTGGGSCPIEIQDLLPWNLFSLLNRCIPLRSLHHPLLLRSQIPALRQPQNLIPLSKIERTLDPPQLENLLLILIRLNCMTLLNRLHALLVKPQLKLSPRQSPQKCRILRILLCSLLILRRR